MQKTTDGKGCGCLQVVPPNGDQRRFAVRQSLLLLRSTTGEIKKRGIIKPYVYNGISRVLGFNVFFFGGGVSGLVTWEEKGDGWFWF